MSEPALFVEFPLISFDMILWRSVFLLRCFNTLQPKPSVTVSNSLQRFVCESVELCRFLACCGLCLFLTYKIRVYRYASLSTLLLFAEKLHSVRVDDKVEDCKGCRVKSVNIDGEFSYTNCWFGLRFRANCAYKFRQDVQTKKIFTMKRHTLTHEWVNFRVCVLVVLFVTFLKPWGVYCPLQGSCIHASLKRIRFVWSFETLLGIPFICSKSTEYLGVQLLCVENERVQFVSAVCSFTLHLISCALKPAARHQMKTSMLSITMQPGI